MLLAKASKDRPAEEKIKKEFKNELIQTNVLLQKHNQTFMSILYELYK